MALTRSRLFHRRTMKWPCLDSARTTTPPQQTSNPCSALNVCIVPCKVRYTVTSEGLFCDLTCTQRRGASNPSEPRPARMSTPPSAPGGEIFVSHPSACSTASTSRASTGRRGGATGHVERIDRCRRPGFDVRRVVRRGLVQGEIQKRPDAQRVGSAPRDRPFRVQPFEVAEQQQPEIAARRQTRPADPRPRRTTRTVPPRTHRTLCLVEHPIQPLVKRVPGALRQIHRGYPHCRLPRSTAACPHRHARQSSRSHVDRSACPRVRSS